MKMTVSRAAAAATATTAANGSESASTRSASGLREKLGKVHVFSVDRTHRWPVQGWSSGDESPLVLDEQFVAEKSARAFTLDMEWRWPLQGWRQPHKPYGTWADDSGMSVRPAVASRWPQGF